jgi:hypothetical protein
MPTPEWARCHVEIYEAPGWLDDCFRSSLWTLFQSAASQGFANVDDVAGDYATMTVTEGSSPSGCGYRKDISSENLGTDSYPRLRVRLRGRGTTPQYKVGVEYTDSSSNETGWLDAPEDMTVDVLILLPGKTVKYVKLYARCNTAYGTAYVDWDYAVIVRNPPLVPTEMLDLDVDLWTTTRISGATLKLLNDILLGVTARRYSLDEGEGLHAYDLSRDKGHADLVNASWNSGGVHGSCLYFNGTSARMETGYKTTIPADGALTIAFWVKASPGATKVICGFGKSIGADWNRVQLNWSSDKVRLYDVGDVGTLGQITLDEYDLTWGCLHNESGYINHSECYVDEPAVYTRAFTGDEADSPEDEVHELYTRTPPSGAARAFCGNVVMVYLTHGGGSLVSKLITARVIDRVASGDPDEPTISLVCEDLGEIMHERTFTEEYANPTQISAIVDDIGDQCLPGIFNQIDATNRTIVNVFNLENAWSLMGKLAETAKFSTGETGANFYVDPGGTLRFNKYGIWTSTLKVSDGSDGGEANILDIRVRETMKGEPKLVNDARVVIFEEEAFPRDEDSWTESADSWSSPDPTDANYPQSDTGDKKSGTACIKFQTTNPGSQYRMRHVFGETDISDMDEVRFWFKYGVGLSPENLEVRMQKGVWIWTWDYYVKSGLSVPAADTWYEYAIDISDFTKGGNPGKILDHLHIRPYRSAGDLGVGGFKVDKLRFVRSEKAGTHEDSTSQDLYGKRTLRVVDKTITTVDYADYVAENIVEHRKNPLVLVEATVPGRAQLGYRPPLMIQVTSLKDGINGETFQIQRARHRYLPQEGYTCDLELVAARKPDGTYEPKVAPVMVDLAAQIAAARRSIWEKQLNDLRKEWM